jgi:hypothetical protein
MRTDIRHNEPLPKLVLDKKRFRVKFCPCGKGNKDGKFVPYVGYENKGYCHSCGETFLPELPKVEQWNTNYHKAFRPRPVETKAKHVSFIPVEVFKASLKAQETNHFVQFLINLFGVEIASLLVSRYFIATSKYWNGATVFWQIDIQGKVRTGKIMLYSPTTGKRVKEPYNYITWVHTALKRPEFELRQCLVGEHLLIDKTKPIAIVESEKTAIIASIYLPQFIWLAAGSKDGLNAEKCSVLKGRTVILFPDLNGFEKWNNKAKELSHLAAFTVSDLLERKATESERKQGLDLADYLSRFDFREFALPEPQHIELPPAVQTLAEMEVIEQPEPVKRVDSVASVAPKTKVFSRVELLPPKAKPESWEQDIIELENYFAGIELPTRPIKLNPYSTTTDCSLFVESHFATVKANNGKPAFLPYLNRIRELKERIASSQPI